MQGGWTCVEIGQARGSTLFQLEGALPPCGFHRPNEVPLGIAWIAGRKSKQKFGGQALRLGFPEPLIMILHELLRILGKLDPLIRPVFLKAYVSGQEQQG
jgi:hypothetical protein